MKIDEKIISEIETYRRINKYINEQDAPPPPPADAAALPPPPGDTAAAPPADAAAAPPAAPATPPAEPVDTSADPEVEKIGDEKEKTKEVEVTDLVQSQKNVEKKQEEYFDTLFKQLQDLEGKLSTMDSIVTKLNDLEAKVEKYRVKTPEEKLELRSLDSGPFNQKLSQFFDDKMVDMEKTGKNEYVLTTDEVEDYSPSEIKKSFRSFEDEEEDDEQNDLMTFK